MPQGNGMGPLGMGPMTGRAAGFCAGNGQAALANPGAGRGCGFGRGRGMGGRGRGFRNLFFATGLPGWMRAGVTAAPASDVVTEAGKQALRNQAAALQSELDLINKRLSETETKTAAD